MNQVVYFTLEVDINGKPYRLSLPMGAAWTEAISAVEEIIEKVRGIADAAQKAHEASQAPIQSAAEDNHGPEAIAQTPVEGTDELQK